MNPYDVIKNPLTTEKAVRMMETENKITVEVAFKATKEEIKQAAEQLFNTKVATVNTTITSHARKKAIIQLSPDKNATEVMAQLGLM